MSESISRDKIIGQYRVVSKIGEGGMGEVYSAHHEKLNRDVAIKILLEAFAQDSDRLARFKRGAQVLASLNHPNIAFIYGLEESDGFMALAMELVEGRFVMLQSDEQQTTTQKLTIIRNWFAEFKDK